MSRVTPPGRAALSSAPGPRSARTPAKAPRPLDTRPSRLRLLLRRQRRLLRPLAYGLTGLALLGAVAVLVRTMQPAHSVASLGDRIAAGVSFPVRSIVIEGRSLTPESKLREALAVSKGDKLLSVSLDAVRARVERLTWVQRATVERRLPGTLMVQITERHPFAVWQTGDKFVLIDRPGRVVAELDPVRDAATFAALPLVVGAGAPDYAAVLLDQLAAQPALRARVAAVVRVGERRWNLRLSNGVDVLLPEGAEAPAMTRLMELHTAQALLDRPVQALDLRLPDRLVVRPLPEPPLPVPPNPHRPI